MTGHEWSRPVWGAGCLCLLLSLGCSATRPTATAEREVDEVNVGYGTQEKARLTTAVTTLTREDIEASSADRMEDVLRLAGVFVSIGPGGTFEVRIQGSMSIHGTREPLFIVDGMQSPSGYSGVVAGLFPRDIEKIEVLKDAAAAAIYGSRGSNGVILITTRSGK